MMGSDIGLSQQALRGTIWSYVSFVLGKMLTFATTVVLARILIPAEFGLMGYCMIAIQYLDILSTLGLDAALISRRDRLEEACNANFVIGLGSGMMLYGATWLLAPVIAGFFHEPQITSLLRVLALVLPISTLGLVPGALLQRELRFRAKLLPDLVRNISKGLLSIILAYQGAGVWSLVVGQIAGELVTTLLLWPMARWRPTWKYDRQVTRESLRFGMHIMVVGIVGAVLTNVDYLLVGRILGVAALGFYTLGYRLPELLIRNFIMVVARVSYPILTRAQQHDERLVAVYLTYTSSIALFTFPVGVGLAAVSGPFISTIYTAKWMPTIPVMQAVAIALAISAIGAVPGVLYKAVGRPEILNRLALIKVPVAIALLWFGTRWGIVGVAFAQIGVALCNVVTDCLMVSRVIRVSLWQIVAAVQPALLSSIAMGIVLLLTDMWLMPQGIAGIAMLVVIGVCVFLGTLSLVGRKTIAQAQRLVSTMLLGLRRSSS